MEGASNSPEKVIVTSDLYKVDDRRRDRLASPQALNVDWIYKLFADFICNFYSVPADRVYGDEPDLPFNRINSYRQLGLGLEADSWASIYEGLDNRAIVSAIGDYFERAIVIGFELPPYFLKICNERHIPYIDISIHPVRFLPDYLFGLRTNMPDISARAHQLRLPEAVMFDFARLSAARTVRTMRASPLHYNSAIFFGQVAIDASLIHDGKIADLDFVESQLLALTERFESVYYKFHPHLIRQTEIQKIIDGNSRLHNIDYDPYDLLALPEIALVSALSSGLLHEANYFGKEILRMLANDDPFGSANDGRSHGKKYVPAPSNIFTEKYWHYILGGGDPVDIQVPDPTIGALKFSLNQSWGR